MGLSIYYSGKFSQRASVSEMIEEVREMAVIHQWKYTLFETSPPAQAGDPEKTNRSIFGISFSPPDCEPVMICCLSNGRLIDPYTFDLYKNEKDETAANRIYYCSTKTQYAGFEVHKLIIHLFRYLSNKYFEQFRLIDDGNYWETNDEKELEAKFGEFNQLIDTVGGALESGVIKKGEHIENYIARIMKEIELRRKQ